nr:MAG TPA: hypothetical protein [Caudoviricetes sp.]
MAQIANCFVCYKESTKSNITHSKIIQIPKSVFQSSDNEYIMSYVKALLRYECDDFDCILNISVFGYYED